MKKKLLFIILTVVLLVTIAGLTVYAISGGDWFIPEEGLPEPPSEEIPQFIEFADPNGEIYKLRFDKETTDGNGFPLYSYTDEHGNYYYYNKNGDFVKSEHPYADDAPVGAYQNGELEKISEEEAKEIADKYLLANFGESFFDKYEFSEVEPFDAMDKYSVEYRVMYGKDGSIPGELAIVSVSYSGVVYRYSVTNPERFENLNFDELNDISIEDIVSFIDAVLNEVGIIEYDEHKKPIFGYESFDIKEIKLCEDDDGCYIGIFADVYAEWVNNHEYIINSQPYYQYDFAWKDDYVPDESETSRFSVSFRYPLENK